MHTPLTGQCDRIMLMKKTSLLLDPRASHAVHSTNDSYPSAMSQTPSVQMAPTRPSTTGTVRGMACKGLSSSKARFW
jgi:hypothetical protein